MKKFENRKKVSFLESIPQTSIDSNEDRLTLKCKFNFAYFNNAQEAGQHFSDWTGEELSKLLDKLKDFSRETLQHWTRQPIGSGRYRSNVLEVYDSFPTNSDFVHPKDVPHQAKWARFRLEQSVRLIGFVIPDEYHDKAHEGTGIRFDRNTFYIVFLDKNHRFYITS